MKEISVKGIAWDRLDQAGANPLKVLQTRWRWRRLHGHSDETYPPLSVPHGRRAFFACALPRANAGRLTFCG